MTDYHFVIVICHILDSSSFWELSKCLLDFHGRWKSWDFDLLDNNNVDTKHNKSSPYKLVFTKLKDSYYTLQWSSFKPGKDKIGWAWGRRGGQVAPGQGATGDVRCEALIKFLICWFTSTCHERVITPGIKLWPAPGHTAQDQWVSTMNGVKWCWKMKSQSKVNKTERYVECNSWLRFLVDWLLSKEILTLKSCTGRAGAGGSKDCTPGKF